ncbi:alpha/beta fold hydrolase [uncultured Cellulomonas sp.]|uniref:thioesterase II family protein n=1 Tax=uncultured Cellulomonas sp. TaxID=189682 RepID=UPI0028E3B6BA|nr:alpha/beta fold hydrolase [uncultured Cellulomonas sp.]
MQLTLRGRRDERQDELVVVALPHAGAVGAPLGALRRALGPAVSVVAPEYPGHGMRVGDAPLTDPEHLVDALVETLRLLPLARTVLLGISMGARVAYEVSRRLLELGYPPAGLICCVSRAPHTGIGHPPLAALPPDEFAEAATRLGLLAPGVLGIPEAAELVRALQADLEILERMPPCSPHRVPVRSAVIGARGDWLVPESSLRAWGEVMVGPVLQLRLPGGHLDWLGMTGDAADTLRRAWRHVTPLAADDG